MEKLDKRVFTLIVVLGILLSSCSLAGQGSLSTDTAVPEPMLVPVTETPIPPSPTSVETPTPSPTAVPTSIPTQAAQISVSENTNCRSGPGDKFPFEGVLRVGEVADVIGRSTVLDYWYVTNAQLPEEGCWLWGEFAQVEGDFEMVPVYTPAPSPAPQVGFEVYVKSFIDCGYTQYVVFAVRNAGSERIWSGYVEVQDLGTGGTLYTARERHPFAASVEPACPPDHGNELWPGETRYIHAPIASEKSDISAVGIITLCTADHQGGTCLTKYSYFYLP
ncbi:MAG: hypothetical protein MUP44_03030 [Anaerolineales bacterium]|nr:hypothetical protein [Anaerolineales bacterium]